MTSFEKHIKKYKLFKKDAENETVSHMSRIEACFFASFHLIEAVMANHNMHINKHTMLRSVLAKDEIFKEDTETVWKSFQTIENQIRPGQEYGGKINGEELKRAKELFKRIEEVCDKFLK
jgi:uncharacterized protein (UPF0332 family)